jgi:uncharacterized UBP type Zn finger protein
VSVPRDASCSHLDQIQVTELPDSVAGCEDCLRTGGKWLHLRICLTCGHVGCCDDSPSRHATAHAQASSHPIIRSLERGVHGETRIPPSPLLYG